MRPIVRTEIAVEIDLDEFEKNFNSLEDFEFLVWEAVYTQFIEWHVDIIKTRKTIK